MEGIIHIRIDDRLIHGQVANFWTNELNATRIMVINNLIASDDIQKSILRMAAPAGVATSIISKDVAVNNIKNNKYKGQRVLIVLKSPIDLLDLYKMGLNIKNANIGNLSNRQNTEILRPNISVTLEEKKALKELINLGVEITAIMTPNDSKNYIKDYLK